MITATRENMLTRVWINRPSTLQQHHDLHGLNVLAQFARAGDSPDFDTFIVYFLSGPVENCEMFRRALSYGWRDMD
jgi:hypothetical protein